MYLQTGSILDVWSSPDFILELPDSRDSGKAIFTRHCGQSDLSIRALSFSFVIYGRGFVGDGNCGVLWHVMTPEWTEVSVSHSDGHQPTVFDTRLGIVSGDLGGQYRPQRTGQASRALTLYLGP